MRATDLKAAAVASVVDPHIDCAQYAFGVRCEVGHAGRARHVALLPKDLDVWPHLQHKQQESTLPASVVVRTSPCGF